MNPEQQRIAIAEACGLFRLMPLRRTTRKGKESPDGVVLWYCESHHGGAATYAPLPNYLSDLNACAEMVKGMPIHEQDQFSFELWAITRRDRKASETEVGSIDFLAVNATEAQRCEAFLKTKGLWTP